MFLTVGIALGSWWAYYELGWGGFWFWDPVENASFMPWLIAAALLHSAIVVEKREALKSWTILLSILAFGFSLLGTFIVRSGVLTSVHAFANDPARGVVILVLLGIFVGGGLTLYAARAQALEAKGVFGFVSRESAIVLNNVLLAVAAFVVFVGTIWPLFAELALGRVLSVGAPFFDMAFTPFMVAIALVMPLGGMLAWKRGTLSRAGKALWPAAALAVALGALAFAFATGRSALGPIGVAARHLDDPRRARRPLGPDRARARRGPARPSVAAAAGRLGQGGRPWRARRDDHRRRGRAGLADRGHPRRPGGRRRSRSGPTRSRWRA